MINRDPHSFADFRQGLIKHINFEIEVDFETRTLNILAKYQLDRPITGSLFLDTRDIKIERIHQAEDDLSWGLDEDDPILGQRLHLKDLEEVSSFSIRCKTSPNASALQWLLPKQTKGGRHPFVYSQCALIHARSVFPCQDSPSVRFTYQAKVIAPQSLHVVMAADSIGSASRDTGTVWDFSMPQPIPAYLFAIAVGDLVFKELGSRTGVYAEPEIIDSAAWEFAENEEKINQAEELLGPYLWDRYDLLIMPPSFPFLGMENPRLTFLSPLSILGDRSGTWIISHELAHAWTGNLVTNATWEDFWINEGWTTYAESRITELLEGVEIDQLYHKISRITVDKIMDRLGLDSPLTKLRLSLDGIDPDEALTYIQYIKGADFVISLEQAVGRDAFDAFLHEYIRRYQFKSITTEELLDFLCKRLPGIDEKVDFDMWVDQPGYPIDAPKHESPLYNQVEGAMTGYAQGIKPIKDDVSGWSSSQVFQFLRMLQAPLPIEDCAYFEELFNLYRKKDPGHLFAFFLVAIPSGHEAIRKELDRFIQSIGRAVYVETLFREIVKIEWTRDFAREMFENHRDRHHPITVKGVEKILTDAGL
jgi:leukotriene-A4 hydrolase